MNEALEGVGLKVPGGRLGGGFLRSRFWCVIAALHEVDDRNKTVTVAWFCFAMSRAALVRGLLMTKQAATGLQRQVQMPRLHLSVL